MPAACLLSVCLSRAVERGQDGGDVRVTVCMTRVCLWREAFGILPFFFFFLSSDAPFSSPRAISCPRYVDLAAG